MANRDDVPWYKLLIGGLIGGIILWEISLKDLLIILSVAVLIFVVFAFLVSWII